MGSIKSELGRELSKHHYDSFSQDSGMQCVCGSDSRYTQKFGDRTDSPWEFFGEHLADVALYWIGVE